MKHEFFLQRCIELADIPGAAVEPNPRVGAVVVHNERIIGEGAHQAYGGPHAEVNAIRSVKETQLLPESTIYVSLEPCNHHGKTPPCTSLILSSGIKKVVIAAVDPNPKMAGKSIAFLRSKGVEVRVIENKKLENQLNPHFWWNQKTGLPYVSLKWAESEDGFMAAHDEHGNSIQASISSANASRFVHRLRHAHQAILVGRNTAEIDNPSLTTRKWPGRNPIRIVLDPSLKLAKSLRLFEAPGCIVLNTKKEGESNGIQFLKYDPPLNWSTVLKRLYEDFKIGSILVEGGASVHKSLLASGNWNALVPVSYTHLTLPTICSV